MNHHSRARVSIVSGPRASGKSTLARWLCTGESRLLVVDPMGEHGGIGTTVGLSEFVEWIDRGGGCGRWALRAWLPAGGDYSPVDLLLRALWSIPPSCVMIDEADMLSRSTGLKLLMNYGRHLGHSVVLVTRRPYDLPPAARANAARLYAFRPWEPRDVAYYREMLPPGAAEQLDELVQYAYLDADLETGTWSIVGGPSSSTTTEGGETAEDPPGEELE